VTGVKLVRTGSALAQPTAHHQSRFGSMRQFGCMPETKCVNVPPSRGRHTRTDPIRVLHKALRTLGLTRIR